MFVRPPDTLCISEINNEGNKGTTKTVAQVAMQNFASVNADNNAVTCVFYYWKTTNCWL
jgi:hypothetical protein